MAAGQEEQRAEPQGPVAGTNSSIMALGGHDPDRSDSGSASHTSAQAGKQITTCAGSDGYATAAHAAATDCQWSCDCNESVVNKRQQQHQRPLILITESANENQHQLSQELAVGTARVVSPSCEQVSGGARSSTSRNESTSYAGDTAATKRCDGAAGQSALSETNTATNTAANESANEQYEEIDGIRYRIVAAVTKPPRDRSTARQRAGPQSPPVIMESADDTFDLETDENPSRHRVAKSASNKQPPAAASSVQKKFSSIRRKSSAMVANLTNFLGPSGSISSHELGSGPQPQRRLSVYEMTKSPPPETSLEIYLSERRRSSTISSKQVQQQLEQQSTFETNYCQRQQYFKDLNQKFINQDNKLLNVVANRGNIHRHSVDIAQLPLHLAQAKASKTSAAAAAAAAAANAAPADADQSTQSGNTSSSLEQPQTAATRSATVNELPTDRDPLAESKRRAINQASSGQLKKDSLVPVRYQDRSLPMEKRGSTGSRGERNRKSRIVIRKFQKLDQSVLHSTPAPDVKIGQRVAYKEYYGNEFGTIRWIGRVPQICPDWTVGVEFDNAIGEGDGSLNGRRYFIAKDCFAKFLSLDDVALVDQHVGRPEPGTMISVMSAAVRPGQMISIQRVSTVHVQHCFLNAPHQIPGADILAVNTRLHCQCPNCGPCAHVIKPPRTQRIARAGKNATHMCQFSTYTCCGMESQEETMCTYKGNKAASLPPLTGLATAPIPPIGNSWFEGAGYLSQLQAQQSKLMPEEYRLGAAPEDILNPDNFNRRLDRASSSRRGSGKQIHHHHMDQLEHQVDGSSPSVASDQENPMTRDDIASYLPASNAIDLSQQTPDCPPSYTPPGPESTYKHPNQYLVAVARPDKANWVEPVWCEPSEPVQTQQAKNTPKSAKVVYRDSIENRYLFPTDDPIDSKLEADLENLSQARYGHCTNSRLIGPRNIFKSLRSLVSCLSAQSNQSELDRHSEETFRFSEHRDKAGNKSVPAIMSGGKPQRFDEVTQNSDKFIISSNNNTTSNHATKNNISNHNTSISSIYTKEGKEEYSSSNRASGTESQKLIDIVGNQDLMRRHHVNFSSSSDCGFSSASQNSFPNYHHAQQCSPMISSDEERKRYQIYKNFLEQLIASTTMKSDELSSLEKILFGRNNENCCLHNNLEAAENGDRDQQKISIDRLRKSCMHSNSDIGFEQMQRAASACCHSTNQCMSMGGLGVTDKFGDRMDSDPVIRKYGQSRDNCRDRRSKNHPRSLCGNSSISGSATLSSDDSFRAAAASVNGIDIQSNNNSNNLPKAFELKLTLSINPDKSTNERHESDNGNEKTNQSIQNSSDHPHGSSFKINIVSSNLDASATSALPDKDSIKTKDIGEATVVEAAKEIHEYISSM